MVTMGDEPALCRHPQLGPAVRAVDCYALGPEHLTRASAILIGTHCDQLALQARRTLLDAFVAGGGRAAVCGQVTRPFLAGLEPVRWLEDYRLEDLQVRRVAEHPVWAGVEPEDLTFRRGVAGFYGRAYLPSVPDGALVVHALGEIDRPLDVVYHYGEGAVLVHGGNDLWGYLHAPDTAARMTPQLLEWLGAC